MLILIFLTLCVVIACSESINAAGVIQRGKKDIDLILIELHMPIIDGYEFLQFLHKEQINIPLIGMYIYFN